MIFFNHCKVLFLSQAVMSVFKINWYAEIPAHYNSSSFVQIHNCSFYGRIEIAILVPHLRLLLSDVIITAFALTTAFGGCLSIETLGNVSLHNVTTVNGSSMNSGGCIFINRNGTNPI
eukprot:PhF_6_TR7962/c1_g1_i1/m.12068